MPNDSIHCWTLTHWSYVSFAPTYQQYTVWCRFSSKFSPNTPHSLLLRVRYGVSFVSSNFDFYSASVTAVMDTILCNRGPCYKSIWLYIFFLPSICDIIPIVSYLNIFHGIQSNLCVLIADDIPPECDWAWRKFNSSAIYLAYWLGFFVAWDQDPGYKLNMNQKLLSTVSVHGLFCHLW